MSARKTKRTVTRLQFTEEERSSPELQKSTQKADKAATRLEKAAKKSKAESLGIHEKNLSFDSLKKPVKLQFEDLQVKKTPSALKSAAVALPAAEVHRQIARSEDDNVGVEAAHRLEGTAEGTVRTAQNAHRSHALKAERKSLNAEKKLDQANVSLLQKRAASEQPLLSTNPLSRWQQKQAIKKEYAAAKAGRGAESVQKTAQTTVKTAKKAKEALEKAAAFVARHSKVYTDYDIPPESLSDPTFAALIKEAEKYLGYPYVWGGSTPSTSFDCSGFVCWVFKNSGVYPLSRTTAQGIFDQCVIIPPSEAKPGDIVFFTGTYDSIGPVSHVAIYVGDGMMIHAGNPIQYASMNTSYFQSHFYAFGRLPRR